MPDGKCRKASSFNEQLVVMKYARLSVQLLGEQLTVAGRPVEHVARLVVADTRQAGQVAAATRRRVVADDEGVRAVQCSGHDDGTSAARTSTVAVGVEQAVVGVVDDERRHVDTADDQTSPGGLVNATVRLKL